MGRAKRGSWGGYDRKYFNGKAYRYDKPFLNKRRAIEYAVEQRKIGYRARVIKIFLPAVPHEGQPEPIRGWAVYTRICTYHEG